MANRIVYAIAAAVIGFQFFSPSALAAPLRCSAEEKSCIATCNNGSNQSLTPNCIAGCRARMNACKQTGCWNNGVNRYCGLTRQ